MKTIKQIFFIAFFCAFTNNVFALNFEPLKANVFEPRIGAFYEYAGEKLRLDIGTSLDLKTFDICDKSKLSIGADFFTFTRLRTAGNFKFPVETSDYYFGLNTSYVDSSFKYPLGLRLRFAHISSHMVDGLSEKGKFNGVEPFVYSREFFDLIGAVYINDLRLYAGAMMLYSTKPKNFLFLHPEIGFDYNYKITKNIKFIAAYDFKFVGIDRAMNPVHSLQSGIEFLTEANVGVFLGVFGYKGKSMHGMFYNQKDDYLGTGFQLMF
jgi:hypothetical protein